MSVKIMALPEAYTGILPGFSEKCLKEKYNLHYTFPFDLYFIRLAFVWCLCGVLQSLC